MRVDVGEPGVDLADAVGVGRGLRFRQQRRAFAIGAEHHVEDADLARGDFLLDAADARPGMHRDVARVRGDLALDQTEERGLARSVLADEAGLRSGGQDDGRALEERRPWMR